MMDAKYKNIYFLFYGAQNDTVRNQ